MSSFFRRLLRYSLRFCYRLPTYRLSAHKNFFDDLFLFLNRNFGHSYTIVTDVQQSVKTLRELHEYTYTHTRPN